MDYFIWIVIIVVGFLIYTHRMGVKINEERDVKILEFGYQGAKNPDLFFIKHAHEYQNFKELSIYPASSINYYKSLILDELFYKLDLSDFDQKTLHPRTEQLLVEAVTYIFNEISKDKECSIIE